MPGCCRAWRLWCVSISDLKSEWRAELPFVLLCIFSPANWERCRERGSVCIGEGYRERRFQTCSEQSVGGWSILTGVNVIVKTGMSFPAWELGPTLGDHYTAGNFTGNNPTTQYMFFSVVQSKEKYVPREVISLVTWVPDSWVWPWHTKITSIPECLRP